MLASYCILCLLVASSISSLDSPCNAASTVCISSRTELNILYTPLFLLPNTSSLLVDHPWPISDTYWYTLEVARLGFSASSVTDAVTAGNLLFTRCEPKRISVCIPAIRSSLAFSLSLSVALGSFSTCLELLISSIA